MVKKATVAGSTQGPAIADPALVATTSNPALGVVIAAEPFPREIKLANDTPMNHIVSGNYVPAGEIVTVEVRDQDQITRIKTDCQHLMELTPAFAELEVQPLRVIDDAAE